MILGAGFAAWAARTGALALAFVFAMALPAQASETLTYSYDALGRLITTGHAGSVNNGQTAATAYDAASNRTNYTVNGAGPFIAIGNASTVEGGNLVFTVTRSGDASVAASASWATAGGTATSGSDFTAGSGTVSFAAGETTKTITVATTDDAVVESSEAMTVTLSSPSANATITTATGTGTITDNDVVWSSTLTSGSWGFGSEWVSINYTGYAQGAGGSMSNTLWNGATITELEDVDSGTVVFVMSGPSSAPLNSGWTSIVVPGIGSLQRSVANYSVSGNQAYWTWDLASSMDIVSGLVTIN